MARGDVLRIGFPHPRGEPGREQAGRRPAIAVQTDTTVGNLPTIMVVPLTGQLDALRFPHTIRVDPSETNGLTMPSVLLVFQLRAIDQNRILDKIGTLEQSYMDQLDNEIRRLLDL